MKGGILNNKRSPSDSLSMKAGQLHMVDGPLSMLCVRADEVQVWTISLVQDEATRHHLAEFLAPDDLDRAHRFRFERDRSRFVVAHGVLRALLATTCGVPPQHVRLSFGPYGKPALDPIHGQGTLQFNLTHSHDLALVALTRGRELGIDVEYCRPMPDAELIAARFFSPAEQTALHELPDAARIRGFYTCWTRKEAYIKARGEGLSLPLDSFDVSVGGMTPARLVHVYDKPEEVKRWSLQTIPVPSNYVATLAVEGHGWVLRTWQWPRDAP